MNAKVVLLCVSAGMASVATAPAAGADESDTRGYMLASSCAACHGPDGQSPGEIPSLNGKDKEFITKALKGFRSGERPATVMNRLAKGYSDEEIDIIGDWFAGK